MTNKQQLTGEAYTAAKLNIDWEVYNTNKTLLLMYSARIVQSL